MAGEHITHADCTWFPTAVLMEFMLPRVFDWSPIFHETKYFPKLTAWFELLSKNDFFNGVKTQICEHWLKKESDGHFESIREDIEDNSEGDFTWKYM